ncbi:HmuY family protein [Sphingobacterium sp. JB170]|uniref:HmuY family protein n=1 Tax=Sphingobacterium sp. JB170 TaxID=1434842 RepID=UPI000B363727|nr:HmuY family protein [Sphingobacterium sp. JB170]
MACTSLSLAFTSCKKEEILPSTNIEDGKSTVIYDLAGDTNGSMGDEAEGKTKKGFDTFLFRLADKQQIWLRNAADSSKWMKTDDWDIAFTGPYNSEVFINNANYFYNPGYEGPATETAVLMLEQPYADVNEAPSDEEFDNSQITKVGWATNAYAVGWFFYSMDTHIAIPIKNRTWVIRLPDGKYAKLELLNVYQGNPPDVTNMNWPAPYFTFRYYVQPDGSKNLRTK